MEIKFGISLEGKPSGILHNKVAFVNADAGSPGPLLGPIAVSYKLNI